METNWNSVYKKSIKGWDELKMRAGGLDASARALLILINGSDPLPAVQRKLGRDIEPPLSLLLARGFVEAVEIAPLLPSPAASPLPAKAATTAAAVAAVAAPGSQPVPQAPPDADGQPARWNALRRQVIVRLAPYFGPDLMTVLQPLMNANTDSSFLAAINALEAKIAMYQGKKVAARLFEGLRP